MEYLNVKLWNIIFRPFGSLVFRWRVWELLKNRNRVPPCPTNCHWPPNGWFEDKNWRIDTNRYKWESSPNRLENKTCLSPPPRNSWFIKSWSGTHMSLVPVRCSRLVQPVVDICSLDVFLAIYVCVPVVFHSLLELSHFGKIYTILLFFEAFFLKQYNPLGFCTVQNGWISNPSLNGAHWTQHSNLRKTKKLLYQPYHFANIRTPPTLDGSPGPPISLNILMLTWNDFQPWPFERLQQASPRGDAERVVVGFNFNQSLGVSSWTEPLKLRFEKKKNMKTRPTRCWKVTYDSAGKKKRNEGSNEWRCISNVPIEKKDGKLFHLPL